MRTKIQHLATHKIGDEVTICGWVKTLRAQKTHTFIEVNDGSTLAGIQVVAEKIPEELTTGASLQVRGHLVESPGSGQKLEIQAADIQIFGTCPADSYPLQKKRHSFEFLRTIAHLRPRTNTQGAVLRVRNALSFATHTFFQKRNFLYIQTPIITASDCEGAGEQFLVTTLNLEKVPRDEAGLVDYSRDFFGKPAYLTVSGQLNLETCACALSDVYSFGPTFRAENSHTSRHLAEFWMIEPEMAFTDLAANRLLAEQYLKHVVSHVLEQCAEDMNFFDAFVEKGLIERLQTLVLKPFAHMSYSEAVEILLKAERSFEFPVSWGCDLQSEHERYLAEEFCKRPVVLTDYPKEIKAFYMRANPDGKTVAAMDILVPKIGEIIGGSQREERLDLLEGRLADFGLPKENYWWYNQLRLYGTVPHSGFGAGFERLVLLVTGMENIRDTIPFPRFPGHAEF